MGELGFAETVIGESADQHRSYSSGLAVAWCAMSAKT